MSTHTFQNVLTHVALGHHNKPREIKVTTDTHGIIIQIEGCEQSVIIDVFSNARCFIMDAEGEAIGDGIELN